MTDFNTQISSINSNYNSNSLQIADYWVYTQLTEGITQKLKVEEISTILKSFGNPEFTIEHFQKTRDRLYKHNRNYTDLHVEIVFKATFQYFEEYIASLFTSCFSFFPYYMLQVESKGEIQLEKVFEDESTLNNLREYIIALRVNKIIQSSNIVESISKLEKIFSFQFAISKEALDTLFVASLIRNILTHNSGYVNDIFIQQLKKRGLKKYVNKGELIIEKLKFDFEKILYNQGNIVNKIHSIVLADLPRLTRHHENLKKNFR